jgi:hypothetical protein
VHLRAPPPHASLKNASGYTSTERNNVIVHVARPTKVAPRNSQLTKAPAAATIGAAARILRNRLIRPPAGDPGREALPFRWRCTLSPGERKKRHTEAAGILERRDGRYRDLQPLTIDMAAPAADVQRLEAHWLRMAFREIRTLAAASAPVESVALLNLHLLTWPDE